MSQHSEHVKRWRRTMKERVIAALGGGCCVCGYNKCSGALEAHHLDPSQKEIALGTIQANPKAWSVIVSEMRKCILVCSNHHKEIHAGIQIVPVNAPRFKEEYADKNFRRSDWNPCPMCGSLKPPYYQTCSRPCSNKRIYTITWDDALMVTMEKSGKSRQEIADHFGVSNMAVHKRFARIAKLEIDKQMPCPNCKHPYDRKNRNQKYCSETCANQARRKVVRPSREVLEQEIRQTSILELGRKYGVSDNAVRKWAKTYGITW